MGKLVYGCWQLGGGDSWSGLTRQAAGDCVRAALDAGVRVFDTAPIYGNGVSEEVLGAALGAGRGNREIVTKFGFRWDAAGRVRLDCSPASVRQECEDSLRRLGTDRIDLYLMHVPAPGLDPEALAAELGALKREGKIRAWGVSNVGGAQLARFVKLGASWSQDYHNALEPEEAPAAIFPFLGEAGFMAYSPLARGVLAGGSLEDAARSPDGALRQLAQGADRERARSLEARLAALRAAAKVRGTSLPRLALDWLASDARTRAVAVGARKAEHIREAAAALGILESVLQR